MERAFVGVVGPGQPTPSLERTAEEVGRLVGQSGAVLVCGGLGGVMEAACRGAAGAGGLTVGILPGDDRRAANPWVAVPVARAWASSATAWSSGPLTCWWPSAASTGPSPSWPLALKLGRPVVGLGTWGLLRPGGLADHGVATAADPLSAVEKAFVLVRDLAPPPDHR